MRGGRDARGGGGGGRGRGGRGGRGGRDQRDSEFDSALMDLARVTRVMRGGKRMRFRACIVVGDRKGRVGFAVMKGNDVQAAIAKATTKAKKHLVRVPIENGTIPHEILQKSSSARVLLRPAPKGHGIIAGGAVRSVLELAGVQNVVSKMLGSNNKVNNVRATIEALASLKRPEYYKQLKGATAPVLEPATPDVTPTTTEVPKVPEISETPEVPAS